MQPVGVYGWTTPSGGVPFHRILEPIRVLRDVHSVNAFSGNELTDQVLSRVDTVLASMLHDEDCSEGWQRLAKLGTHRLVLDVDDWMWDPDWKPFREAWTDDALNRLFDNVRAAHVVTTPSNVIGSYLSRFNENVWVVPNTVPAYVLEIPHPLPEDEDYWLIYQGSPSHVGDFTSSTALQLAKFLRDHPGWGMGFIGAHPGDLRHFRTWHRPWTSDRRQYYALVASGTVGIGPLRKTMFNIAKSSLRAVEYAALGVVPVLPDLDPYRHIVKTGHNGVLIRPHETLRGVLADLAKDPLHIDRMAVQARSDAQHWTTEAAISAWVEAWGSI